MERALHSMPWRCAQPMDRRPGCCSKISEGHPRRRARAVNHDRRLPAIAAGFPAVVERLLALPRTLIHNEFYPSNVLIERRREGVRVCPVDWEMAARGPALIDLAALTAGNWNETER